MPLYAVTVEGEFTTETEAKAALSDMEEAIGKNNGYLRSSKVEDEDAEEEDESNNGFCEDYPCCGHEWGDCFGQKYGSDESIKAAAVERMRMEDEGYFFEDEGG